MREGYCTKMVTNDSNLNPNPSPNSNPGWWSQSVSRHAYSTNNVTILSVVYLEIFSQGPPGLVVLGLWLRRWLATREVASSTPDRAAVR